MPSPSMNTSSAVIGGYWRSGPQRYSVPFRSFGTAPLTTSRSCASTSMRSGWPQPRYNGMSGNLTSIKTSSSLLSVMLGHNGPLGKRSQPPYPQRGKIAAMSDTLPLDQKLRTIGVNLNPEMIAATAALVAPLHAGTSREGVKITRDLKYGPHERHRLDVFEPQPRAET